MEGGVWGIVIVISAFMIQVLSFGTSATIGVYNIELLEYFQGETLGVSLIGSINFGVYLGSGPIVSLLMTKYSYRKIALTGSILVTVGLLAMPFLPYIPSMCLFYGVLTGFGSCCVYIPSHVLSGLYYEKYRSVATGVSTSGSGLGGAVMPVLAGFLIDTFSWKGSLIVVAGLNLHLFIFSALLRPPSAPNPSWNQNYLSSQLDPDMAAASKCARALSRPQTSTSVDTAEAIAMQVIIHDIKVVEDDEGYNFWGLDSGKLDFIDKISHTTSFSSTDTLVFNCRMHKYGSVSRRPKSLMACFEDEPPLRRVVKSSSACLKHPPTSSNAHRLTLPTASMGWRGSSFAYVDSADEFSFSVTDTIDPINTVTLPRSSRHVFIFTNYGFDIYFLSNIMWNAGYAIMQSFAPEFLRQRGLTLMETAWLSGTFGLGAFIGGVIGGLIGNVKGVNRQFFYTLANIAMGGTILLLPYSDGKVLYIVILLSSGLSCGILLGLLLVVLTDLVGVESLGNGLGYLMLSNGLGTTIGPPIASLVKNDSDGFGPSILLAGAACILGGVVMLMMPCHHANPCSGSTSTASSASSTNSNTTDPVTAV